MLSALLPGVREFRTPLVTGALWGACVWLIGGSRVAESAATRDFVTSYRLDALPSTALFAAGLLMVYLVGSLLVVRRSPFLWLARRYGWRVARRLDQMRGVEKPEKPEKRFDCLLWKVWQGWGWRPVARPIRGLMNAVTSGPRHEAVDVWLRNEFEVMAARGRIPVMRSYLGGCAAPTGFDSFYDAHSINTVPDSEGSDSLRWRLTECFVQEIKQEKPAVEVRIQMRFPEVYAEIDRLKVESELRMSIFWPLMLASGLLAGAWSPWALSGLLVPPLMMRDAFKRAQEASDKTWSALVAGEVTSPILDAMAAAPADDLRDFKHFYGRPTVVDDEAPSVVDDDEAAAS